MSDVTETITLTMSREEAEALSFGISDILCWVQGFEAARQGTDLPLGPMGVSRLQSLNIKLKSEL